MPSGVYTRTEKELSRIAAMSKASVVNGTCRKKQTHCKNGHPLVEENLYFGIRGRSCKICALTQQKERRKQFPEICKQISRKKTLKALGWTLDEYHQALKEQTNLCAICKKLETQNILGGLRADHNHTTGKKRQLLCNKCNTALGLLMDDSELCRQAAEYLERHKK